MTRIQYSIIACGRFVTGAVPKDCKQFGKTFGNGIERKEKRKEGIQVGKDSSAIFNI